jgi:hypothetical protein
MQEDQGTREEGKRAMIDRVHKLPEELLNLGEWFALPNSYVDRLMATMEPTDFLVLLIIRRQTYGLQMAKRRISQGLIMKKSGLCRNTVKACLERLESAGHIIKTKETDFWAATEWQLNQDFVLTPYQRLTGTLSTVDRVPINERQGINRDDWIACAEKVGTEVLLEKTKQWIGNGWKPTNVNGIIDFAQNGGLYSRVGQQARKRKGELSDEEWEQYAHLFKS